LVKHILLVHVQASDWDNKIRDERPTHRLCSVLNIERSTKVAMEVLRHLLTELLDGVDALLCAAAHCQNLPSFSGVKGTHIQENQR